MCVMMLSKATQNIYFTKLMFISVWCHVIIPKRKKTKEAKNMDSCDSHGRSTYNDETDPDYLQVSV